MTNSYPNHSFTGKTHVTSVQRSRLLPFTSFRHLTGAIHILSGTAGDIRDVADDQLPIAGKLPDMVGNLRDLVNGNLYADGTIRDSFRTHLITINVFPDAVNANLGAVDANPGTVDANLNVNNIHFNPADVHPDTNDAFPGAVNLTM